MVREARDSMLSVKEVAGTLSVSAKTVYLLIRAGSLKAHRVGAGRGVIRISQKQLDEYLRSTTPDTEVGQAGTGSGKRLKDFKFRR